VSSGAVVETGCCCDDCSCCVDESSAPNTTPVQAAPPVSVQHLLALPPATTMSIQLASSAHDLPSAHAAIFTAAALPLYRRDCAWLI
jgi:hypothetical protein